MVNTRIILSGLWVATMFTYLWGDVLRLYAGDVKPGEMFGMQPGQGLWLVIAVFMLTPIVMVVLTLTLNYPAIRWVSIIVAILLLGGNLIGLPGYPSAYDKFLIIVSLVFNALTVWYAWQWVP
jgi:hypothetical protein